MLWKSRDGAFGAGQVLVLQTTPSQPYGAAGSVPDEAQRLMQNLLAQSYTALFLDYGPTIPDPWLARPVIASAEIDMAAYPLATPAATVTVDVAIWVFPHV